MNEVESLLQLNLEGRMAEDVGLEFFSVLLVVFGDMDVHGLLEGLGETCDFDSSIGA